MAKKTRPPTARQMAAFSKLFSKKDWETCCEVKAFVEAVSTDLKKAESIGGQILRDDYLEPNDDFEVL